MSPAGRCAGVAAVLWWVAAGQVIEQPANLHSRSLAQRGLKAPGALTSAAASFGGSGDDGEAATVDAAIGSLALRLERVEREIAAGEQSPEGGGRDMMKEINDMGRDLCRHRPDHPKCQVFRKKPTTTPLPLTTPAPTTPTTSLVSPAPAPAPAKAKFQLRMTPFGVGRASGDGGGGRRSDSSGAAGASFDAAAYGDIVRWGQGGKPRSS